MGQKIHDDAETAINLAKEYAKEFPQVSGAPSDPTRINFYRTAEGAESGTSPDRQIACANAAIARLVCMALLRTALAR